MTKAIIYHGSGWSATYNAKVQTTERKGDDGNYRRVYTATVRDLFVTGEKMAAKQDVEVLVLTDNSKLHYYGTVEGMARNGDAKILLTSAGSPELVKQTILKIGGQQNGRSSFTG